MGLWLMCDEPDSLLSFVMRCPHGLALPVVLPTPTGLVGIPVNVKGNIVAPANQKIGLVPSLKC